MSEVSEVIITDKEKETRSDISTAILNHDTLIPYKPYSLCPPVGTCIPIGLATEIYKSLDEIVAVHGNIDDYVVDRLKYVDSKGKPNYLAMCKALSGEQVDSVAMAIFQIERHKGFILGDMAGVGKGRCCAAVMRYAYHHDLFPVFLTITPNLFSDNYRDLIDIGGFYTKSDGTPFLPKPFILNANSSQNKVDVMIVNNKTGLNEVKEPALSPKKINQVINQDFKETRNEFQYMVSTYSQFAGSKTKPKQDFLANIAPKCVFICDESHTICGNSNDGTSQIMTYFYETLALCDGVMFSSATYAKTAQNMKIYAPHTDMGDAVLGLEGVIDAIEKGGNQLQEFMSSNLARAGQYIRRERSYDGCNVYYRYNDKETKEESFERYDRSINMFLDIQKFSKEKYFRDAKVKAIQRFADVNEIVWCENDNYGNVKSEARANFVNQHFKQWIIRFTAGDYKGNSFAFIDALLFALKADFVSQTVLDELIYESKNTDVEFNDIMTTRKVVLGVRSTLENVYDKLNLREGEYLDKNDFSLYFVALFKQMLFGDISAFQLCGDFIEVSEKELDEKYRIEKANRYEIQMSDFEDGGLRYKNFLKTIEDFNADLPMSPIDYFIDKIESVKRITKAWVVTGKDELGNDFKTEVEKPNSYGNGQPNFVVTEVTARKFQLVKSGTKYKLVQNTREKNKSDAFARFNNGAADVIILNPAGSTGSSAHSSKEFKDKRPRSMVLHQVELNVNVEVQKRGRINRTGQLFFPTYMYAISLVPSEIRRLLMLRIKLHSLDANTSANQMQSNKATDIEDRLGNPVEDFCNKYGATVIKEFFATEEGAEFEKNYVTEHWTDKSINNEEGWVNKVLRDIQFAPSENQAMFYDIINQLYIAEKKRLIEAKDWDLETDVEDLQASPYQRLTKMQGDDSNPFKASVYEEDYHINKERIFLTKDEVEDLMANLYDGKKPDVWEGELINDYTQYMDKVYIPKMIAEIEEPDLTGELTDEEKQEILLQHEMNIEVKKQSLQKEKRSMLRIFNHFTQGLPVYLPVNGDCDLDVEQESFEGEDLQNFREFMKTSIDLNSVRNFYYGKFAGYKIVEGASVNKYTRSNIEMIFVSLDGVPKQTIRPTRANLWTLRYMMENRVDAYDMQEIANWRIEKQERDVARIFTGNLFDGFVLATKVLQEDAASRNPFFRALRFTRFTMYKSDETRVGIRLLPKWAIDRHVLQQGKEKRLVEFGSEDFINGLLNMSVGGFTFSVDKSILIEKTKFTYKIVINGGVRRGGVLLETPRVTPSPLYKDMEFIKQTGDIEQWRGLSEKPLKEKFYYPSANGKKTEGRVCAIMLRYVNSSDIYSFIRTMKNFTQVMFMLKGEGFSDYYDIKDAFVPEEGGAEGRAEEVRESEKEVGYYLESEFKESMPKPPNYIRYDSEIMGGDGFGVLFTQSVLTPTIMKSFGIYPTDITIDDAVSNFLSLFKGEKLRKVTEDLNNTIETTVSDAKLGNYIIDKIMSPEWGNMRNYRYVFGDVSNPQVGKDFKEYVAKNGKIKTHEVVAEKATSEEKAEFEEIMKPLEKPINMVNVQKFVILMRSK